VLTTVKCAVVRLGALIAQQSARLITNRPIGNVQYINSLCVYTRRHVGKYRKLKFRKEGGQVSVQPKENLSWSRSWSTGWSSDFDNL
jgi:hypothetical protein